jgi:L-aspartate oxidase
MHKNHWRLLVVLCHLIPMDLIPFDVIVVGGGAAGLYAALCLPEHLKVGLITKDPLPRSASGWAQGGIAAAIAPDDSPTLHLEDTLKAGAGLCEPAAVSLLVNEAPRCITALVDLGVAFDRTDTSSDTPGGSLALTLEAAHSRRRVLHAADTTGRAIVATLAEQVMSKPHIQVISEGFVLDLWMSEDTLGDQPTCLGVCLMHHQRITWLRAGATVLATGGSGQVFAQTTNPKASTGDGAAMAWRSGAVLRDLEFFQFHPTALCRPGAPRFLISEAVRGEGAYLFDHQERRFAFDYHPDGELAPRDVVSRAIFSHLQKTTPEPAAAHVWLDLRSISPERIRHRFPNIIQKCQKWGIDVFQEPIPVAPAAHYWMGGVQTDHLSRTTIPQLYAVGETASTGVHGANRLASNSLLECLVYGAQLREVTIPQLDTEVAQNSPASEQGWPEDLMADWETLEQDLQTWRQQLAQVVWDSAGICREQELMTRAIAQIQQWRSEFNDLPLSHALLTIPASQDMPLPVQFPATLIRTWGELRNLLDIAYLIVNSASFRAESRGGHYRIDYPATNPDWQCHTLVQGEAWGTSSPVEAQV